MKHILYAFATCGPLGYLPASGTVISALVLPMIVFLFQRLSLLMQVSVSLVVTVAVFYILYAISDVCSVDDDPPYIVIDEFVGCLWTAIGLTYTLKTIFIGLFAFRFFDIIKCKGVSDAESIGGPVGVIADDCVAGLYACVVVHVYQLFTT